MSEPVAFKDCLVCNGDRIFDAGDDTSGHSQNIPCPACQLRADLAEAKVTNNNLNSAVDKIKKWHDEDAKKIEQLRTELADAIRHLDNVMNFAEWETEIQLHEISAASAFLERIKKGKMK